MDKVSRSLMVGPYGQRSGGRAPRLSDECRRNLMTLRSSEVLLIPDDPESKPSKRGYLHDVQMLVHSFGRREGLPKFSTWKTEHPETGARVLAVAIREGDK